MNDSTPWLLANEHLPEPNEKVIVFRLGVKQSLSVGWYNYDKEAWFNGSGWKVGVTHWKPIGVLPR